MNSLPIFISLKNKPVLVVGAGDVAFRKIQTLLKAQAQVFVIAHEVCEDIQALSCKQLSLEVGNYQPELLTDKWLVIAATNDEAINEQVHQDAIQSKVFVNVVDDPKRCHFIMPAIIDRSPIVMAISSGGEAPVLARLWKEKFESLLPQWTGQLASIAGRYRQQVKQKITNFTYRRHFWERFFRGDIASYASQNDWQKVEQTIKDELANTNEPAGTLFYVSIGDNTPDNLTLKALQTMQLADLVLYDSNTNPEIIELCRKDSDKKIVAENEGEPEINKAIEEGKIVVKLIQQGLSTEQQINFTNQTNHKIHFVKGMSVI